MEILNGYKNPVQKSEAGKKKGAVRERDGQTQNVSLMMM